jgi:hypothetical protein
MVEYVNNHHSTVCLSIPLDHGLSRRIAWSYPAVTGQFVRRRSDPKDARRKREMKKLMLALRLLGVIAAASGALSASALAQPAPIVTLRASSPTGDRLLDVASSVEALATTAAFTLSPNEHGWPNLPNEI